MKDLAAEQNETTILEHEETAKEAEEPAPENVPWQRLNIGGEVVHKSFGRGHVVTLDDNYVFVKFKDRESKFQFPAAFEKGYLSCVD